MTVLYIHSFLSRIERKTYYYILIVIIRIGVCAHSLNASRNVNSSIINIYGNEMKWNEAKVPSTCLPAAHFNKSNETSRISLCHSSSFSHWHSELAHPNQSKCIARYIFNIYGPGEINFSFFLTRRNFPEFIGFRIAVRVTCNFL